MLKKSLIVLLLVVFSSITIAKNNTSSSFKEAIFGGGCFWCLEADFDKLPGIKKTISGYDGGVRKNPTYSYVASGKSKYVEVVKVLYDPKIISYKKLVNYYWKHIDPTVKDAQFCDHGPQYRSVIFYLNSEQEKISKKSKGYVGNLFPKQKVYTDVLKSTHFYTAEKYHQNYYKKNPLRYKYYRWNCERDQKVKEVWHGKQMD